MYGICASATYRSSVRGLIPSKAAASLQLSNRSSLIRSTPQMPVAKGNFGSETTLLRQVGSSSRLRQIAVFVGGGNSGPSLKATVKGFKTLEGVKQLHPGLPHGVAWFAKLIDVPDGEFDPINGDASLICHLKFDG
jgi:hypothetical protein